MILNFEKCSIINKIKYIITKIGTEKIFTSRKEEKIAVLPDISEAKWFKIKKLIPVYIDNSNIFVPINNLKEYENIYINAARVIKTAAKGKRTIVYFIDKTKLEVNKNENLIIKYISRAISINHNS